MSHLTTEEIALEVLLTEANKIKNLISNQQNHMCIAQCKAFEEVVDTQMYGFSRQIDFAIKIGLITYEEGQKHLIELERELNKVYTDVYEESKQNRE